MYHCKKWLKMKKTNGSNGMNCNIRIDGTLNDFLPLKMALKPVMTNGNCIIFNKT